MTEVVIDGRVLAFAAAMTMLTGLSVALLPAWRIGRIPPASYLKAQ